MDDAWWQPDAIAPGDYVHHPAYVFHGHPPLAALDCPYRDKACLTDGKGVTFLVDQHRLYYVEMAAPPEPERREHRPPADDDAEGSPQACRTCSQEA